MKAYTLVKVSISSNKCNQ